jgi:DNA-binding protein HU-beta
LRKKAGFWAFFYVSAAINGGKPLDKRIEQTQKVPNCLRFLILVEESANSNGRPKEGNMVDKPQMTVPLSKMLSELAEKHEMPKKKLAELFDDFIDLTVKNLKKGNKVRITGLGIMQVRNRPARMGRNPATGEAIKIKASRKVAFRVSKDVKEAI